VDLKIGYKASSEQFGPRELLEYAVAAEDYGLDSVTVADHYQPWRHVGGHAFHSVSWLSALGERTSRVILGTSVLTPTFRYNPAVIAQAFATMGSLFPGRVFLGVGTGEALNEVAVARLEWPEFKIRFARLREAVRLIRILWKEDQVTFEGEFWQLNRAGMEPKPVQKPHPPIWFGASGPTALRRAARLGDGFFGAGSSSATQFAEQVQIVRAALAESGRSASDYPIAKRVYIVIDDNRDRARQSMSAAIAQLYGRPMPTIEAAAVAGTPDDCAAQVAEVAAAGAELILFTSMTSPAVQMERIAAEVIPQVAVS